MDSRNLIQREMRLMRQLERRRRYRSWVQAFQLGMLVLFADQILKTYCGAQLLENEMRPIFGQSVVQLTRIPDQGVMAAMAARLPESLAALPAYALLALWVGVLVALIVRASRAGFGELAAFAVVLGGLGSSLLSRHLTSSVYETLAVKLPFDRYLAFTVADLGVLVGSYFLLRIFLSQGRPRWIPTRTPI